MCSVADFERNHLLSTLTPSEQTRWCPHLEFVELPLGRVLCEPGHTLSDVYLPTKAIVSIL